MAGLDPAVPLSKAQPCHTDRDLRVEPGDDGGWVGDASAHVERPALKPYFIAS